MAQSETTPAFVPPFRLTFDGELVTTVQHEAAGRDLARQTFAALRNKGLRVDGRVKLRDADGRNLIE